MRIGRSIGIAVVMAVMGWSQVSMLARYQHVLPAMLDDTALRLEGLLPGITAGVATEVVI